MNLNTHIVISDSEEDPDEKNRQIHSTLGTENKNFKKYLIVFNKNGIIVYTLYYNPYVTMSLEYLSIFTSYHIQTLHLNFIDFNNSLLIIISTATWQL